MTQLIVMVAIAIISIVIMQKSPKCAAITSGLVLALVIYAILGHLGIL